MKTLIVFYSYSGKTRKFAHEKAEELSADIYEIKDRRRPGVLKAYTAGAFKAMKGSLSPIEEVGTDLSAYDKIIIMSPVWAGYPAPPINNVFDMLPSGRDVEIFMISASGSNACHDRLKEIVESKGCKFLGVSDMK